MSIKMKKGNFYALTSKKNTILLARDVMPGESYDWMIDMKAPAKLDTYVAEFAMYNEHGTLCKNNSSRVKFEIKIQVVEIIKPEDPTPF